MKCPVCQNEIEDGRLYCGKCGYEIQIVPEFEAELENNIMENMSDVINELAPEKDDALSDEEMPEFTDEEEERPSMLDFLFRFIRKHILVSVAIFVVFAVAIGIVIFCSIQEIGRAHV